MMFKMFFLLRLEQQKQELEEKKAAFEQERQAWEQMNNITMGRFICIRIFLYSEMKT